VHQFNAGTAWHLTPEEGALAAEQQRERVHVSELEQDVIAYLSTVREDTVTVRDVLIFGLKLEPDKPTYSDTARKLGSAVAEALERNGWQKDARRGKDKRTTYVRRGVQG
jgi:hypothetical protein